MWGKTPSSVADLNRLSGSATNAKKPRAWQRLRFRSEDKVSSQSIYLMTVSFEISVASTSIYDLLPRTLPRYIFLRLEVINHQQYSN